MYGQSVSATRLQGVGDTGASTGPHLHFEQGRRARWRDQPTRDILRWHAVAIVLLGVACIGNSIALIALAVTR
jgi:hypothetical protein